MFLERLVGSIHLEQFRSLAAAAEVESSHRPEAERDIRPSSAGDIRAEPGIRLEPAAVDTASHSQAGSINEIQDV